MPGKFFNIAQLVKNPDLRRLFDYWCDKRGGRAMPARVDIDPVEIPWALSRLFLMDYSPEGGFRYRLAGAEVARVFGRSNLNGLTVWDLLSPERARLIEHRWVPIVRNRSVAVMTGMIYLATERTPIGERIVLPLADAPDGPVTGLVAMTVCEWVTSDLPRDVKPSPVHYICVDDIP